ncbi:MAG: twin-arginine translocation signal domain-containing protein [Acidimicrobiales bacterium]
MTAVLDRLATAMDGRISRRGFLARSALAGTAMAVAPTDFLLKPVGAYQAICSCAGTGCDCGSQCCDGYTEFCCSMIGMNRCPPGNILGGWWKVDDSEYCNGGPRYYMDCNAPCNGCGCGFSGICDGACSGTGCGCARGDCGFRKTGCVYFRYGQCNQHIGCIGPIVCRVVTCVPPWTIDPTCSTTVAVDGYTRYHDAPCLSRPFGALEQVSPSMNGFRLRGWAVDPNTADPLMLHVYANGQVVAWVLADGSRPDLAGLVPGAGPRHGFDVEIPMPDGNYQITVYALNQGDGSEHPVIGSAPVGVGHPFGTYDMQAGPDYIRLIGWTIDPDRPRGATQVHVWMDGNFAGAWDANVFRTDVANAYRHFGGEHGFDLRIPASVGQHRVQLWVIDDGGASAPVLLGEKVISVGGSVIGAFDWVFRSPSGARVVGWAVDPDTTDPLDIHVYIDGVFVGSKLADVNRPDVGALFPQFGDNHGYDIDVPAFAGTRQVTVYAIGKIHGDPYTLLGTMTAEIGNLPFGWVDATWDDPGGVRVIGWVIDPDRPGPVDLHVYVDGQFAGSGRTGEARPDVAGGYPAYGDSSGFSFVVPASPGPERTICVYAIDAGGANHPLLGCRTVPLA